MNRDEIFSRFKQEIQSAALSREDDGNIYIFLKENEAAGGRPNLLIFDGANPVRKTNYRFYEKNGSYFIRIDEVDYEMLLPDEVSDQEPFSFSVKDSESQQLNFENYI
jgi:hypothetical protein